MAREKTPDTTTGSRPGAGEQQPPGDRVAAAGGDVPSTGPTGDPAAPRKPNKSSKEVYFAVLPDKYEPLLEEDDEESPEERRRRKEEKKRKKREKYKKYRKNMGRALCWTWRCLVAGLQSLGVYAAPFTAATTLATTYSKT